MLLSGEKTHCCEWLGCVMVLFIGAASEFNFMLAASLD
jgi:hypothetical protein